MDRRFSLGDVLRSLRADMSPVRMVQIILPRTLHGPIITGGNIT